ncbi:MAG: SpoIID/LytB domain-containing protein [Planctomycetota bacterium]|jgi:stage II sporulation protein D
MKHSRPQVRAVLFLLLLMMACGCRERRRAEVTVQMDAGEKFWIRVLLFEDIRECKLSSGSGLRVEPAGDGGAVEFGRSGLAATVKMSEGKIVVGDEMFSGTGALIVPDAPHIFNINGLDYRGKLQLSVNTEGDGFDAINVVPLEPYLAGVVGSEMPSYWEPGALEAQAIAARTYCMYIKKRFGRGRRWDVRRTQANQVYGGVRAESSHVWEAVNRTYGQVLVCKDGEGQEGIFPSYYSSTCGGHTEGSRGVFGDSFAALRGRVCPYCRNVARPRIYYWPTVQYDKADVTGKLIARYPSLARLGEVTEMVATRQSDYEGFSRLTSVKLTGPKGQHDIVRAEDLRLTIDPTGSRIRSAAFEIANRQDKWAFVSGRGYGHAVGMCQCGAQAMARQGKSAAEILSYYYAGSRIERLY